MKKIRKKNANWARKIDQKYADLKTIYGAYKDKKIWKLRLWQPLAKNVNLIIYDKKDQNKIIEILKGKFKSPNWHWNIEKNYDGYFYHYEITQENGIINLALDPFAKSMAAFNWEGKNKNIGKSAFIDYKIKKKLRKLNPINKPQPIIYETNVRDLTSLRKDVLFPGSFNAIKEIKLAKNLNNLGINSVQFLPIHNCYTLNENDKNILLRNSGKGWRTNYNWGYDPHNYFSINGWYSSNPKKPYVRMNEFDNLVKYMHKNNINVILDVVYNHTFTNNILDNVFPNYYYRKDSKIMPVDQPAIASERLMVRRIIVESLKWFVNVYDVDGYRFDLLTFIDLETIKIFTKELRKLKPNIILHGEAWNFTDLKKTNSLNKGIVDNNMNFAYFNDTTRDSIKGEDDHNLFKNGLVNGNINKFNDYVSCLIGNIKNFDQNIKDISIDSYTRWTKYPNNVLNYTACHDGHTLWDKINLTIDGTLNEKLEIYRQSIMMQTFLPGRTLYLGGTEILYTKPIDKSGQDNKRTHKSKFSKDFFKIKVNEYHENSYKTTDFTNGLRWELLNKKKIKKNVFNFIAKVNKFKLKNNIFRDKNEKKINKNYSFNLVSKKNKIIDLNINGKGIKIRLIHNFSNNNYKYHSKGKILIDSKIKNKNQIGILKPKSSILIRRKNG